MDSRCRFEQRGELLTLVVTSRPANERSPGLSCFNLPVPLLASPFGSSGSQAPLQRVRGETGAELRLRAEFLHGAFNAWDCFGQIVCVHDRAERHLGIKRKEPGFGYGRYLGRLGQVKKDEPGALPVVIRKIRGLGFEVIQNRPDGFTQPSLPSQVVRRLRAHINLEHRSHVRFSIR